MYTFTYNHHIGTVIDRIGKKAVRGDLNSLNHASGTIMFKTKGNKIYIQEIVKSVHPLRRVFVGKMTEKHGVTTVNGHFRYSIVFTTLFLMLLAFSFYKHLESVRTIRGFKKKLIITAFFVVLDLILAGFFVTGSVCFRQQERHVIKLLKNIEVEDNK